MGRMHSILKSSDSLRRVTHQQFRISKRGGLDKVSACHDHSPQKYSERNKCSVLLLPSRERMRLHRSNIFIPSMMKKSNFPNLPASGDWWFGVGGTFLFHTCKTYIIPNQCPKTVFHSPAGLASHHSPL